MHAPGPANASPMRSSPDRGPGPRTPGIPVGRIDADEAPVRAFTQGETTIFGVGLNEGIHPAVLDAPRPAPPRPKPVDLARLRALASADPDTELLARAWKRDGHAVAALVDREIAGVDTQLGTATGYPLWAHIVRRLTDRRHRLGAISVYFQAAAAGGKAVYLAPDPKAADEEAGHLVLKLALGQPGVTIANVMQRLAQGLGRLVIEAEAIGHKAEQLDRSGKPLLDTIGQHRTLTADMAEKVALIGEFERLLAGYPGEFAAQVAAVVEDHGGTAEITASLVEARLLAAGDGQPNDEAASELAAVSAKLKRLGSGPDAPSPGRVAVKLQERHAELTTLIESRRDAYRQRIAAKALETVAAAVAGDMDAFDDLQKAASATGDAFPERFPEALAGSPLRALRGLPAAPLAHLWI